MPIPENIDSDKLAEVALAILWLSAYTDSGRTRVWKSLDWEVTDLLFEKGWIGDPKSKAKSALLTADGARLGESFFEHYFGK